MDRGDNIPVMRFALTLVHLWPQTAIFEHSLHFPHVGCRAEWSCTIPRHQPSLRLIAILGLRFHSVALRMNIHSRMNKATCPPASLTLHRVTDSTWIEWFYFGRWFYQVNLSELLLLLFKNLRVILEPPSPTADSCPCHFGLTVKTWAFPLIFSTWATIWIDNRSISDHN